MKDKATFKSEAPTTKQMCVLERVGAKVKPKTRREAQILIDNHFRPKSKRQRQKPNANRDAGRTSRKRKPKGPFGRYYLTPKAWHRTCNQRDCENPAVAFRPFDRSSICESCIKRLGIHAKVSKAWEDGGSKAGASVTVRFECPICGGPHRRGDHPS